MGWSCWWWGQTGESEVVVRDCIWDLVEGVSESGLGCSTRNATGGGSSLTIGAYSSILLKKSRNATSFFAGILVSI
jgi:hypothetical protein